MNFARIFVGKFGKLCDGRLSCRRSVPPCIGLVKKQSGTLRLRLCVRRYADTPSFAWCTLNCYTGRKKS